MMNNVQPLFGKEKTRMYRTKYAPNKIENNTSRINEHYIKQYHIGNCFEWNAFDLVILKVCGKEYRMQEAQCAPIMK